MLKIERVDNIDVERSGDTLTLKISHAHGSRADTEIVIEFEGGNKHWPRQAQSSIEGFAEAVTEAAEEEAS